ncbi:coatomer subunit alpha-2 [Quercus suber]|uniref:Coatomer subunit alpha-2 n=1 Tax=Quercus suber TaxID=58331 RepID=A0AAW0LEF9_QUESU
MCASFHPKEDLVVSASLDQTVRVWDIGALRKKTVSPADDILRLSQMNTDLFGGVDAVVKYVLEVPFWDVTKRTGVQTFRHEHDRFWILASHREMNLLAAGHDSGMIVFKLERERPAFAVSGNSLFYTKDRFLRFYEFSAQKDTQVMPIRRPGSTSLNQSPRTLSYSPTENAVLICSDVDGGSYELYFVPKDSIGRGDSLQETKRGPGGSAVFVARNRAEDRVVIFDLQQRLVLGELQTPFVKYVVWSLDMENVALLSKHAIIIASKKLVHQCTLHETIRVKSGAWDDNGVFIYTTLNHIKYCLPNGDSGIIRTVDVPIYITKVSGNTIFCLDRDGKNRSIVIDATEYIFKLFLLKKRYDHVMSMIRNSQLFGEAVIAYLQQKGFPDVALHFVKDERTRFNLAIESGNINRGQLCTFCDLAVVGSDASGLLCSPSQIR